MLFDFKKILNEFNAKDSKKKSKLIFYIGIAGILLIFLPTLLPKSTLPPLKTSETPSEYTERMQRDIGKIINGITGNSDAYVLITLESGTEYVYANEKKENKDTVDDKSRSQIKDSSEEKHVIVNAASGGGQQALIITEIAPKVRGVVVVCKYGDDEIIRETVINAVTTALDIPSSRVCVTNKY